MHFNITTQKRYIQLANMEWPVRTWTFLTDWYISCLSQTNKKFWTRKGKFKPDQFLDSAKVQNGNWTEFGTPLRWLFFLNNVDQSIVAPSERAWNFDLLIYLFEIHCVYFFKLALHCCYFTAYVWKDLLAFCMLYEFMRL